MISELRPFFDDLWNKKPKIKKDITTIRKEEWSDLFEKLMRNRLVFGFFRYGSMFENVKSHKKAHIDSIKKRIDIYSETDNLEMLVDIANICLIEFVQNFKEENFIALDDKEHINK